MLGHLGHGHDARHGEPVLGLDFLLRGGDAALADLHTVEGDDQTLDLDVGGIHELGVRLIDGLARRGHVLDHHHAVAILELVAQHAALIGAVILDLLAVGAVTDLLAIQLVHSDGSDHRQRDALVRWAEHDVEIQAEVIVNRAGIVLAQAHELLARHVSAGIHEERGLAAALEGEVAEL